MDLYEEIFRLKKEGKSFAVATIVECLGSSPQKIGAKMLILDDSTTLGTVGGGCVEAEVIQAALMAIKDHSAKTLSFNLKETEGGLVCGGRIKIFIEPITPEPSIVILGAGHVGKALSKIAKFLGFKVIVIDDREEFANRENLPDADDIIVNDFETIFKRYTVAKQSYIVIATRGHNHDLTALKSALSTDAQYIGLLGSKRKRNILFKRLSDEGFSQNEISRIITPVGLAIGSVTPQEIAISIMAQIVQLRRQNDHSRLGNSSCSREIQKDGTDKATASLR
ncbi:MAG: XdhC/CoxI family protein [Thermodesulfovibrionales bacterium]|nr:XdhC/CoxI family protein [Thermodesulfovibrionales bacterium]